MRRVGAPIALVLVLLATAASSTATPLLNTWTPLGPPGSQVLALAASPAAPGVVYAASDDRIWKSADSGETWAPTADGPTNLSYALVADPGDADNVVAGSFDGSLSVTSDGGEHWAPPTSGFAGSSAPLLSWSSSGLFALVDGALYSSSDGGEVWDALGTPPDGNARSLLVVSPQTIYVGTEIGTIQVSDDGGASWVDRSAGLPTPTPDYPYPPSVERLVADPADPEILYAELNPSALFRSPDGGATWTEIPPPAGSFLQRVAVLATAPTTLLADTGLDVLRSTDGGVSWVAASEPPFGNAFSTSLYADPSTATTIYAAAFGVYRSTDAGDTFAYTSTGLGKAVVTDLVAVPGSGASYLATTGAGVMRTDDDGASWEHRSHGVRGQTLSLASDPTDPETFYLVAAGDLWATNDGGDSWHQVDAGISGVVRAVAVDASNVYAGGESLGGGSTFARSTDGGDTWTAGPLPLDSNRFLKQLAIDPADSDRVYAGTTGGLYRSANSGSIWTRLHTSNVTTLAVAVDGDVYASIDSTTIVRFTRNGLSPVPGTTGPPPSAYSLEADPSEADTLYAGTAQGVYQTADDGHVWVKLPTTGLESQFVSDIVPRAPRHLMVATSRGTASIDLSPMSATVDPAANVTTTSAEISGAANPSGSSATAFFEYGPTAAYGSTTPSSPIGNGTEPAPVSAALSGLSAATTYHYRLLIQSDAGIAASPDATFTTDFLAPTASTSAAGQLTATGAKLNGTVNPRGGPTTYWFEYGPDSSYGLQTPDAAAGSGVAAVSISVDLTGLEPATTYHFRLVAENAKGTALGDDRQFTTSNLPPTMTGVQALTLRSGSLEGGAVPLRVSWGATPGTEAICNYQVERGTAVEPPSSLGLFQGTELETGALPANGLYYRVRALGCDATQSDFASSPAARLRLLEESAPALQRSAGWTRIPAADASGGHVLRTTTPNARVTLTFTGRSLAFVAPKGPLYAAASVSLDGAAATQIGLYRASRATQIAVYIVNFPSSGAHKVVIRAQASGSRRRVDVDAFAVIS